MTQTLHAVGGADSTKSRTESNILGVVRMIKAARDMEAEDLAAVLGVSRATIYDRLKGRTGFTVGEVAILSETYGIPLATFFAGPDALLGTATQQTARRITDESSRTFTRTGDVIGRAA